eukprot:524025_1
MAMTTRDYFIHLLSNNINSWFWLDTTAKPPCWIQLNKQSSDFIQTKYKNNKPTQIHPFELTQKSTNNTVHKIRLLPNVQIPMAIECNYNYPLIYLTKIDKSDVFGYGINFKQQKRIHQSDNHSKTYEKINIESITQKIMFSNQPTIESTPRKKVVMRWYYLGIGNGTNIWYPFDAFNDQQIDKMFNDKQLSFNMDSPTFDGPVTICFETNSFKVRIPFGIVKNVSDNSESIIVRCEYDCFGFINDLHVSLYSYDTIKKMNYMNNIQTINDCVKLSLILCELFYENDATEKYENAKKKIMELKLDGIKLYKWVKVTDFMRSKMKVLLRIVCTEHGIVKKGPGCKICRTLMHQVNYLYKYNVHTTLEMCCYFIIGVNRALRQCFINGKYTIHSIRNNLLNNTFLMEFITSIKESFKSVRRTKNYKCITQDEDEIMTE